MSEYQNLDLRSPKRRGTDGSVFRWIFITLAVVLLLFVVLAVLGAINGGDAPTVPADDATRTAPAATAPVGE